MNKFVAKGITILRLNDRLDRHGHKFPSNCYCQIPKEPVPVKFNHAGKAVGTAVIRKVGDKIVADIEVSTKMTNTIQALNLLRKLTPSIEAEILDTHEASITAIAVQGVSLSQGENADSGIKPLGNKIQCATPTTKAGLH